MLLPYLRYRLAHKRTVVILNFTNREILLDAPFIADSILLLDTLGVAGTEYGSSKPDTVKPFQGLLFEKI
jgi:hypothetical protein